MKGKKIFKIKSATVTPRCIRVYLSGIVCYSESERDYSPLIYLAKSPPFDSWKDGDYIEVDLDRVRCRRQGETIGDTSIVRILDDKVAEELKKAQIKLYELKNAKEKLVPMLNNFSQKIINENFFFSLLNDGEFWFDETALPAWKVRLDDMTKKFEELERKNEVLAERCKNLTGRLEEYEEYKDKYEKIRNTSERELADKTQTNARLEERLESSNAKVLDLTKRLTNSENENSRLLLKLDEKNAIHNQKTEVLNNHLTNLQLESGEKGNELKEKEKELKRKEEEVKKSQKEAGQSRKKLLTEKVRLKYGKLEVFANQIGINLQQVDSLCRYCERLVHAQKSCNQSNIETHESNIAKVREGLRQKGLQVEDIQKFCYKCEKVAKMRVEINEIRQQQSQYEARQETIPLYNNRIN